MTERRRRRVDPVESEIEAALAPGRFIPDRISFTFVSELEGVAATIAKLVPIDAACEAQRASSFMTSSRFPSGLALFRRPLTEVLASG